MDRVRVPAGPVPGNRFFGFEYFVANLPFKLRQDAILGSTAEIVFRMLRESSVGDAGLFATVFGYLVDL